MIWGIAPLWVRQFPAALVAMYISEAADAVESGSHSHQEGVWEYMVLQQEEDEGQVQNLQGQIYDDFKHILYFYEYTL